MPLAFVLVQVVMAHTGVAGAGVELAKAGRNGFDFVESHCDYLFFSVVPKME